MTPHDHDPRLTRDLPSAEPGQPAVIDEVDDTLKKLLPWAMSFLLHAGIVAIAMLLVWTTFQPEVEERGPTATGLSQTPAAPSLLPMAPVAEAQEESITKPTFAPERVGFNGNPPSIEPVNHSQAIYDQIHRPPNPRATPGEQGRPGIPNAPEVIFPKIEAQKIVFVIDASGSLIDTFPFVVNELRRTLYAMGTAQNRGGHHYEFAVIFFRNGQVVEVGGPGTGLERGLKPATQENVARATEWLRGTGIGPGGKTDPLPAIRLALSYNPQSVVLLSDNISGHGIHAMDPDGLIDAVLDARRDRDIAIDTVQFLYPDVAESYGESGTLERLAERTGGAYKFVTAERLGLR